MDSGIGDSTGGTNMFDDLEELKKLAQTNNDVQTKQLELLNNIHEELRNIKVRLSEMNK